MRPIRHSHEIAHGTRPAADGYDLGVPAKRRRPGPTHLLAATLLVIAVLLPVLAGPDGTSSADAAFGRDEASAAAASSAPSPTGEALDALTASLADPAAAAAAPAPAFATALPATAAGAAPGATSGVTPGSGTPAASAACTETHGTVSDHSLRSAIAGRAVSYRVYLPPCYRSSGRRYPLLILMTGSNGSSSDWTALGLVAALDRGIAARTLPPMIVVMPDGTGLAEVDVQVTAHSWDGVITHELLPVAERAYCTVRTPAYRAVGGLSRGGFWAVEIALQHPGLVGSVGGHSAWFTDDRRGTWDAPLGWARWVRLGSTRYWLDAGPLDPALPGLRTLARTLAARHAPVVLHAYPTGSHGNAYWASHVGAYLAWYGAPWPRSAASLPAC